MAYPEAYPSTSGSRTTIEDLSPEMLVKIFSYYIESETHMEFSKNLVPVCKAWRKLSFTPSLWKKIRVMDSNYLLSVAWRGLTFHTQRLEILSNAFNGPPDCECLSSALPYICDLKSLMLSGFTVDANTFAAVAENCPNLQHLHMCHSSSDEHKPITLEALDPILTTCAPKLKHLNIEYCDIEDAEQFLTAVATKCTSLEVLRFISSTSLMFPIYKFMVGCPRLQELTVRGCEFMATGGDDICGFTHLTEFKISACNFNGLDVCTLLENSKKLDNLILNHNRNFIFNNVSKIASDRLKIFQLGFLGKQVGLPALVQAVEKWKHTLLCLKIVGVDCSITNALKTIIDSNPCPKLEFLLIEEECINKDFMEIFVQNSRNLFELNFTNQEFHDLSHAWGKYFNLF